MIAFEPSIRVFQGLRLFSPPARNSLHLGILPVNPINPRFCRDFFGWGLCFQDFAGRPGGGVARGVPATGPRPLERVASIGVVTPESGNRAVLAVIEVSPARVVLAFRPALKRRGRSFSALPKARAQHRRQKPGFTPHFSSWAASSGSRVSILGGLGCAPRAPSLTGHRMLPRITQQSYSAVLSHESQIEPWLAHGHRQASAASASRMS
jgi:hypothetical protein